jgi:hypothetical protein
MAPNQARVSIVVEWLNAPDTANELDTLFDRPENPILKNIRPALKRRGG